MQAGVYYIPNGSHASWTDATDYYAERVRINSLEIPLTVQYSFFSRKTNHFFAGAGFYYGRNISGTVDEINNVYRISGPLRVGGKEASDDIKAADFGITINGGYQLHSRIFFRLRYQYGLVNESPLSRFGAVIRPYSMALQVGYFFGGRPKPRPMPNGEAAPAAPGGQKNKKIISGSTKS